MFLTIWIWVMFWNMGRIYFLFFSIQKIMSNCYIIFLKSFQNFKIFLTFQGLIHEVNLLALVTFYELNISFLYTHVAFAYVPDDGDYFFFFCFSKALISFSSFFSPFVFSSSERFWCLSHASFRSISWRFW